MTARWSLTLFRLSWCVELKALSDVVVRSVRQGQIKEERIQTHFVTNKQGSSEGDTVYFHHQNTYYTKIIMFYLH